MLPALLNSFPLTPFSGSTNRLSSIFDDLFPPLEVKTWSLPLTMWQDENSIHVEMDAPGLTASDLDISVHEGVLTIQGERKSERKETLYESRSYGKFVQRVTLPSEVQANSVQANLANGILDITLPKTPESKPRKIEIRALPVSESEKK